MLSWMREKFGTSIIGGIITFITFVFVFYGVFSPKATRGLHEGAVAGIVNGDAITIGDFNRELNRRIEYFKAYSGGKLSDEQLKSLHIREAVFRELANRKLLVQEARKKHISPADEEIREKIREIPAFQKDGRFDLITYKQVLEANGFNPGSFEREIRDSLSAQKWESFFKTRLHVSDDELKREFLVSQDKRNIKYVVISTDVVKRDVVVSAEEVRNFLGQPSKTNIVKMKFEAAKDTLYKGKDFEIVKAEVAKDVIASEKIDQTQKLTHTLADRILPLFGAGADTQVNAILKPYGLQVKKTGMLTRKDVYIPGIGESKDLLEDAFKRKSPIDPKEGGKAKKYALAGRVVVALVTESQKPDLALLSKEKEPLLRQIVNRKSQEVFQNWIEKLASKAKIDANPSVIGSGT